MAFWLSSSRIVKREFAGHVFEVEQQRKKRSKPRIIDDFEQKGSPTP